MMQKINIRCAYYIICALCRYIVTILVRVKLDYFMRTLKHILVDAKKIMFIQIRYNETSYKNFNKLPTTD